jgi:hypothetical protein
MCCNPAAAADCSGRARIATLLIKTKHRRADVFLGQPNNQLLSRELGRASSAK